MPLEASCRRPEAWLKPEVDCRVPDFSARGLEVPDRRGDRFKRCTDPARPAERPGQISRARAKGHGFPPKRRKQFRKSCSARRPDALDSRPGRAPARSARRDIPISQSKPRLKAATSPSAVAAFFYVPRRSPENIRSGLFDRSSTWRTSTFPNRGRLHTPIQVRNRSIAARNAMHAAVQHGARAPARSGREGPALDLPSNTP
jgi:hypothetical protein